MNEKQLQAELLKALKENLHGYEILSGKSLLYRIMMDEDGKLLPDEIEEPTRGNLAFQVDIVIRDSKVPLVVLEIKQGGFTTHDILTYSTKAMEHKEIYPYLRYGLVVGGKSKIDRRFFTHNSGFDFAVALESIDQDIGLLTGIIKRQLGCAKAIIDIMRDKEVSKFESILKIY